MTSPTAIITDALSEPKWTKGPWYIKSNPYIHVRSDSGCVLAADYTTPENSALIAAAPDLYEALQTALHALDDLTDKDSAMTGGLAALAKARGKS